MGALTYSSKHERSGHSRSLSFPSVCVTKKWADHITQGRHTNLTGLFTFEKARSETPDNISRFGQIFDFSFSKERGQLLKKRRLTLNKLWKFGRRIVKTLCTYFQFNSIKCIIHFQYNSVKIVSFSFYFPFSFIQLGSCSSQPLVSFCPFIVCFLLFYKTYL